MTSSNPNMLVLFTSRNFSEKDLEKELEQINNILVEAGAGDQFYIVTELVDRNKISSNLKKIKKESRHHHLRTFRFLLNKN